MDTLAVLIRTLFSLSFREHPAPPPLEEWMRFLRQPKLTHGSCEKTPLCLQEAADCAMITPNSEEKRKKTHG